MCAGKIIFLNGAPSAGKTSIAHALQETLEEPYLCIGVDDAGRMLPECFRDWNDPANHQVLFRAVSGLNHCIVTLASTGNNVIVDHLMLDGFEGYYLAECAFLLAHCDVLFVGVVCELEELERRERKRTDREGLTRAELRSAYTRVHAHGVYDLEVDTTNLSPHQCAEIIKDRLYNGPEPKAFTKIRARFISEEYE